MLAGRVLFVLSLFALVGAINALRAANADRHPALRPWWFPALLAAEAVPLRVTIHAIVGALLIWAGALEHRIGRIGLWLTVATWVGYVVIQWRAARTKHVVAEALRKAGIDPDGFAHIEWRRVFAAYPYRLPRDIERIEDIEYADGVAVDVYRRRDLGPGPHPALLQIHGGSWRGGNRRQQARPLLHRMARAGWVCVAASYPLVPEAVFPDQLVGLKRAVAWMRSDGRRYGIDPGFIAVTGGSAGGHLAALLALTANRLEYQPGFEDSDTSIQAAVPIYGIYDFLNRNQTRDEWPIIPRGVMRASRRDAEQRYREASPLDQAHAGAPPFFVIHGAADAVVPTAEAEQFVDALRSNSDSPVVYAEIPGANHAFDVLDSLRTHYVISGIQRFLEDVVGRQ
ncbi:MAG: alpha/beta hydrolase [Acidimicrobiia bacterium]|nr:alpha/beta hydrolase [Acidimicrobiia bacterium]